MRVFVVEMKIIIYFGPNKNLNIGYQRVKYIIELHNLKSLSKIINGKTSNNN